AAAHVAVFLVAVASVGVDTTPASLVAISLAVLVGSAVPLNIAGWGPREGVTAGLFALAGLGSTTGLTVSVVFGVLAAVATLPGVLVLLGDVVVRRRRRPALDRPAPAPDEARHGSPALHPPQLQHVDRRLHRRRHRAPPAAVQRPRLRPGRPGACGRRRDPRGRHHGPQRHPSPARPRPRAQAGPARPRPHRASGQGDGHPARPARPLTAL